MTCKYSYRLKNNKVVGEYQCEVEDFRKLWKYIRRLVSNCIVKMSDGTIWLYYKRNRYDKGTWEKIEK